MYGIIKFDFGRIAGLAMFRNTVLNHVFYTVFLRLSWKKKKKQVLNPTGSVTWFERVSEEEF